MMESEIKIFPLHLIGDILVTLCGKGDKKRKRQKLLYTNADDSIGYDIRTNMLECSLNLIRILRQNGRWIASIRRRIVSTKKKRPNYHRTRLACEDWPAKTGLRRLAF